MNVAAAAADAAAAAAAAAVASASVAVVASQMPLRPCKVCLLWSSAETTKRSTRRLRVLLELAGRPPFQQTLLLLVMQRSATNKQSLDL